MFLLETKHVLGADRVGHPEVFIIGLPVPTAIFSRKVVNKIERSELVENLFDLAVISYVSPDIVITFGVV